MTSVNDAIGYGVAITLLIAAIIRCRAWSKRPTRPMTVAAFALAGSIAARLPQPGVDRFLERIFSLANMTELIADVLVFLFAWCIVVHILLAMGRIDMVWSVSFCTIALLITAVAAYGVSEQAHGKQDAVTLRTAMATEAVSIYQAIIGLVCLSAFLFLLYGTLATRPTSTTERIVVGCYLVAASAGAVVGLFAVMIGVVVDNNPRFYELSFRIWLFMAAWLAAGLLINSVGRRNQKMPYEVTLH